MDKYELIHGRDESSFDFTSTHRLPTVSAAQAFDDLTTDSRQFLPTGLDALDHALAGVSRKDGDEAQCRGGARKGQIMEVWGPPASGKTTFAMQITANALRDGDRAVWVDTFHPLCYHRLGEIMNSPYRLPVGSPAAPPDTADTMANLMHYTAPTLAHLIALLCKPGVSSIPGGTSVIVIDGLPGLINRVFPKNLESRQNNKASGPASRRPQVLQSLVSALQKLSATKDLLIIILGQCATKMQAERGAAITPAISSSHWEQGIFTRLVLFQDWTKLGAELRSIRLVGLQKNNNQASPDGIGPVFPFEIYNDGLTGLDLNTDRLSLALASDRHRRKRKFHETGSEIADSEGEDYGWEDEDEADMPNMPPQWQGSEDLLGCMEEVDDSTGEVSEPEEGSCGSATPEFSRLT